MTAIAPVTDRNRNVLHESFKENTDQWCHNRTKSQTYNTRDEVKMRNLLLTKCKRKVTGWRENNTIAKKSQQ